MTQEIIYTSAPRGLKPSSQGFCTVASTAAMPQPVASLLEGQTGYRPLFPPGDSRESDNPVNWSHLRVSTGGRAYSLLARIAADGLDYSGRNNKLAHMLLVEASERVPGGPAWCLSQPSVMEREWTGEPRILPHGRRLPGGAAPANVCSAWDAITGDAGWAGVLAEAFLADPSRPVYLFFEPGCDLLPLFVEAIALLPEDRRWEATFSTYFTSLSPNVECQWRCVVKGSAEANDSRRFVKALRIDLTTPPGRAEGGALVDWARTGRDPRTTGAAPAVETEDGAEGEEFPTWTGEPHDGLNGGTPRAANDPENVPGAAARGTQRNATGAGAEYRLGAPAYTLPGQVAVLPPPRRRVGGRGRGWIVAMLCLLASIAAAAGGAFVLMGRPGPKIEPPAFALTATEPVVVVIGEAKTVPLLDQPLPPGWKVRFVKEPVGDLVATLNGETITVDVRKDGPAQPSAHEVWMELDYDTPSGPSAVPSPLLKLPVLIVRKVTNPISPTVDQSAVTPIELKLSEHTGSLDFMKPTAVITDSSGKNAEGISFISDNSVVRIDPNKAKSGSYDIQLTGRFPKSTHTCRLPNIILKYTSPQKPKEMAQPVESTPTEPTVLPQLKLTFTRGRGFRVKVMEGTDVTANDPHTIPKWARLRPNGYLEWVRPKEETPWEQAPFSFLCKDNASKSLVTQPVDVNIREWLAKDVVEAASDGENSTVQWIALPTDKDFPPSTRNVPIAPSSDSKSLTTRSVYDVILHSPINAERWLVLPKDSGTGWKISLKRPVGNNGDTEMIDTYSIEFTQSAKALELTLTLLRERRDQNSLQSRALELSVLECVLDDGSSLLFTFAPGGTEKLEYSRGIGATLLDDARSLFARRVLENSLTLQIPNPRVSLHAEHATYYISPKGPADKEFMAFPESTGEYATTELRKEDKNTWIKAAEIKNGENKKAASLFPWGVDKCLLLIKSEGAKSRELPIDIHIGHFLFLTDVVYKYRREERDQDQSGKPRTAEAVTELLGEKLEKHAKEWDKKQASARNEFPRAPGETGPYPAVMAMFKTPFPTSSEGLQKLSASLNDPALLSEVSNLMVRYEHWSAWKDKHIPHLVPNAFELEESIRARNTLAWVERLGRTSFSVRIDLEYEMDAPKGERRLRRRLIDIRP